MTLLLVMGIELRMTVIKERLVIIVTFVFRLRLEFIQPGNIGTTNKDSVPI